MILFYIDFHFLWLDKICFSKLCLFSNTHASNMNHSTLWWQKRNFLWILLAQPFSTNKWKKSRKQIRGLFFFSFSFVFYLVFSNICVSWKEDQSCTHIQKVLDTITRELFSAVKYISLSRKLYTIVIYFYSIFINFRIVTQSLIPIAIASDATNLEKNLDLAYGIWIRVWIWTNLTNRSKS